MYNSDYPHNPVFFVFSCGNVPAADSPQTLHPELGGQAKHDRSSTPHLP